MPLRPATSLRQTCGTPSVCCLSVAAAHLLAALRVNIAQRHSLRPVRRQRPNDPVVAEVRVLAPLVGVHECHVVRQALPGGAPVVEDGGDVSPAGG